MSEIAARVARVRVPLGFFSAAAVLYLAQPTTRSLAFGGAIALVGESLRIWAAGHLDKGREVTQTGPYRLTRHPLYLGSAMVAAGAAVASARISVAIIVAFYMAITLVAAMRHEEVNMRTRFGSQYDDYLRLRVASVERRFSLKRAMQINKEYRAMLGLIVFAMLLASKVALTAD